MAIVWILEWDGITPEQYDDLRREIDYEGDVPRGLRCHAAAFSRRGLVITEVWQSADHVQVFMDGRFIPATQRLSMMTVPRVDLFEAHNLLIPPPPVSAREAAAQRDQQAADKLDSS